MEFFFFFFKYEDKKCMHFKNGTYESRWIIQNKINNMHLDNR